jgi:hypothetical protein
LSVIVQGPYLVRSTSIAHETVDLTGDWSNATGLEIFAPSSVSRVRFNGEQLHVTKSSYGSLVGKLGESSHTIPSIQAQLPPLKKWKVNDGLPERNPTYDDSRWVGKTIFVNPTNYQSVDSQSRQSYQYPQSNASSHIPSSLCRRIR